MLLMLLGLARFGDGGSFRRVRTCEISKGRSSSSVGESEQAGKRVCRSCWSDAWRSEDAGEREKKLKSFGAGRRAKVEGKR